MDKMIMRKIVLRKVDPLKKAAYKTILFSYWLMVPFYLQYICNPYAPNEIQITMVPNCEINAMLNSKLLISNAADVSDLTLFWKAGGLN